MYRLQTVFSVLLVFYLIESTSSQTSYCAAGLCQGRRHIACRNNIGFGRNCSRNARIIPISPNFRRRIVGIHNSARNRVARGSVNNYLPAIRMATMVWNEELARLASLHVRLCTLRRDSCRNTAMFRFSGQNGGRSKWVSTRPSIQYVAMRLISSWFRTNRRCNMQQLNNITRAVARRCGHFTVMVQEKNNAVGCSILRQRQFGEDMQFMTCNYAYNNIQGRTVYRNGTMAANCTTGVNPQFPALCSIREPYRLATVLD